MKKIPTLFKRVYENHKIVGITEVVTPGFEWVLAGGGISTIKYDDNEPQCKIKRSDFGFSWPAKGD